MYVGQGKMSINVCISVVIGALTIECDVVHVNREDSGFVIMAIDLYGMKVS